MKTLEEIVKQEPVYIGEFDKAIDVFAEFSNGYSSYDDEEENAPLLEEHKDDNILFAYYSYENYEGTAFVLFEKDGKLYEINGGHFSCYGLEGQWEPEEVMLKALEHQLTEGYFGSGFKEELCEFLGVDYNAEKEYEVYF